MVLSGVFSGAAVPSRQGPLSFARKLQSQMAASSGDLDRPQPSRREAECHVRKAGETLLRKDWTPQPTPCQCTSERKLWSVIHKWQPL